ncbi:hypothetical protein FGG08_004532 [Glutinoglossum americanum]|uniref:chitinase n=1 Tax=Glutinoglossum americanum TaxID=1670608 RepID=A0A9P8L2D7_9PEZI|nr:hypothetical protein FGG08_004532 [Glutinoglossum americanum]
MPGQGGGQERLGHYCQSTSIDIIPIGFVNVFPQQGPGGYPGSNFGNACGGYYKINGTETLFLESCPLIEADIIACQSLGKKIFISLGGATPGNNHLSGAQSAEDFADFLWSAFGPQDPSWTGPRPFGSAVVDGFDLDIESGASEGIAALVNRLRGVFSQSPDKTYYISGAPQCPIPDPQLGDAIANSWFDFIWVQFYNTHPCSARDYISSGSGSSFNYGEWVQVIKGSMNPNAKLFIGLPGGPTAVEDPTFYLGPTDVGTIVEHFMPSYPSQFGGIMLWDAKSSGDNVVAGEVFADCVKAILLSAQTKIYTSTSTTPMSTYITPSTATTTELSTTTKASSTTTTKDWATTTTEETSTSTKASSTTTTRASTTTTIAWSTVTTKDWTTTTTEEPSTTTKDGNWTTKTSSTTTTKDWATTTIEELSTDTEDWSWTTEASATTTTVGSATTTTEESSSAPSTYSYSTIHSAVYITTVVTTEYVDICPTGLTTITETYTTLICPTATTTPVIPEGWTTVVTVCSHCYPTPTVVTLTLPQTKVATETPMDYATPSYAVPTLALKPGSGSSTGIAPIMTPISKFATSTKTSIPVNGGPSLSLPKAPVAQTITQVPPAPCYGPNCPASPSSVGKNGTSVYVDSSGTAGPSNPYDGAVPKPFTGAAMKMSVDMLGAVVMGAVGFVLTL